MVPLTISCGTCVCSLFLKGYLSTRVEMNISGRGINHRSALRLKESSGSAYTTPTVRPMQINSLASQCNYQHNHIMFHWRELRCSQSGCFIKTPSYKKCTLLHNIYSVRIHLHQCPQILDCCVCVCVYVHKVCLSWEVFVFFRGFF